MSTEEKSAFVKIFGSIARAPENPKSGGSTLRNAFADALNRQKPSAPAAPPTTLAETVPADRKSVHEKFFGSLPSVAADPKGGGSSTQNPFARPLRKQAQVASEPPVNVAVKGRLAEKPISLFEKTFGSVVHAPEALDSPRPAVRKSIAELLTKQEAIAAQLAAPPVALAAHRVSNASSLALCLFDLDDTLIRTEDLELFRGRANVGNTSSDYTTRLVSAYRANGSDRLLYTPDHLLDLSRRFPDMKWGVFTRSPRHYAKALLDAAFPNFAWDVVIGYEDVKNTKPNGEGIWAAMRQCGLENTQEVALVGDNKVDVQAAYQGGCWSILDQSSWTRPWATERYWAIERLPDAIIENVSMLSDVLEHPSLHWPELEHRSNTDSVGKSRRDRFDTINHFYPEGGWVPITVLGRLFGEYGALVPRRSWHALTDQVLAHKEASQFPHEWVEAIRHYLGKTVAATGGLVTVIPFKPGRHPRLEALLAQVEASNRTHPIRRGARIEFNPAVLAFREGAVSSHGTHLSRDERFTNVGQNMFVGRPEAVSGRDVVVIDDVATTGATLLWAHRYLLAAGARSVKCMSLTKAVGIK